MILDSLCSFDNKASLLTAQFGSGAAGTYTSTNSYDTGSAGSFGTAAPTLAGAQAQGPFGINDKLIGGPVLHDIGRGRPVFLLVQITTTVTSAGAATLGVNFISSANLNGDLSTPTIIFGELLLPKATLIAGYRLPFKTVPGKVTQQFVGLQLIIGTATLTAGAYTGALVFGLDDHADILGVAP